MANTIKAVAAAATKIQALVRGHRGRKKVEAYVTQLIEEMMMMSSQEKKQIPTPTPQPQPQPPQKQQSRAAPEPPKPAPEQPQSDDDDDNTEEDDDVDDTDDDNDEYDTDGYQSESMAEEIVVVIEEEVDDTDAEGDSMIEFLTYVPPTPPVNDKAKMPKNTKSVFERYNEQLKQPMFPVASPKKSPASIQLYIKGGVEEPSDLESESAQSVPSWASKKSTATAASVPRPTAAPQQSLLSSSTHSSISDASSLRPMSTHTAASYVSNESGVSSAKGGWWALKKSNKSLQKSESKSTTSEQLNNISDHSSKSNTPSPEPSSKFSMKKPTAEAESKSQLNISNHGDLSNSPRKNAKPTVVPGRLVGRWKPQKSAAPNPLNISDHSSESNTPSPEPASKFSMKKPTAEVEAESKSQLNISNHGDLSNSPRKNVKPPVVPGKLVGRWKPQKSAAPDQLNISNHGDMLNIPRPSGKPPVIPGVPGGRWAPKKSTAAAESTTAEAPQKSKSTPTAESSISDDSVNSNPHVTPTTSKHTVNLGTDSVHSGKFAIPWLSSQENSSREPSPRPTTVTKSKNSLVNRYLSAAVKSDMTEYERKLAQIEADRARGRWNSSALGSGGSGDGSNGKQRKDWKFLQPKLPPPPLNQFDEEAAIKLQALVRGVLARRWVGKYVDSLIEEMINKMNREQEEEKRKKEQEARRIREEAEAKQREAEDHFDKLRRERQEEEDAERRRQEEEEARIKREKEEEERLRWEEEEARRRAEELLRHVEGQGLPLWWMENVPHNTLGQEDYEAEIKKDKIPNIIDYKLPPGWEKRKANPLEKLDEEDEDENDDNLDKILGSSKEIRTKTKRRGSFFSCMCLDAVEEVEDFNGNDQSVLGISRNDYGLGAADDEEDTDSSDNLPAPERAPPPSPTLSSMLRESTLPIKNQ